MNSSRRLIVTLTILMAAMELITSPAQGRRAYSTSSDASTTSSTSTAAANANANANASSSSPPSSSNINNVPANAPAKPQSVAPLVRSTSSSAIRNAIMNNVNATNASHTDFAQPTNSYSQPSTPYSFSSNPSNNFSSFTPTPRAVPGQSAYGPSSQPLWPRQDSGRRRYTNGPIYPGTPGFPSGNVNDAKPITGMAVPSGAGVELLKQDFPIPVKGSDAETFVPAGFLEKAFGPLAPIKSGHVLN